MIPISTSESKRQNTFIIAKKRTTSVPEKLYHLVKKSVWEKNKKDIAVYFPPTYEQDKLTVTRRCCFEHKLFKYFQHATSNPSQLLTVGTHFLELFQLVWWSPWRVLSNTNILVLSECKI